MLDSCVRAIEKFSLCMLYFLTEVDFRCISPISCYGILEEQVGIVSLITGKMEVVSELSSHFEVWETREYHLFNLNLYIYAFIHV